MTRCSESWAFFHASAETSTSDQPRSIAANIEISSQDFQVVRPTQSQSLQCAVLPDAAILVQIRKLQQELEDRRRAMYYHIYIDSGIRILIRAKDSLELLPNSRSKIFSNHLVYLLHPTRRRTPAPKTRQSSFAAGTHVAMVALSPTRATSPDTSGKSVKAAQS